jgi:hypothetical protein
MQSCQDERQQMSNPPLTSSAPPPAVQTPGLHKSPKILLFALLLIVAGCTFTPYVGRQRDWPTADGAFVKTVMGVPIYPVGQLPARPYDVIGSVTADNWPGFALRAKIHHADAVVLTQLYEAGHSYTVNSQGNWQGSGQANWQANSGPGWSSGTVTGSASGTDSGSATLTENHYIRARAYLIKYRP